MEYKRPSDVELGKAQAILAHPFNPDWEERAKCREAGEVPPDNLKGQNIFIATFCMKCPVVKDCAYQGAVLEGSAVSGVWGGYSEGRIAALGKAVRYVQREVKAKKAA